MPGMSHHGPFRENQLIHKADFISGIESFISEQSLTLHKMEPNTTALLPLGGSHRSSRLTSGEVGLRILD